MKVIEPTGHDEQNPASKVLRNLVLQTCCRICRISGEVKLAQLYAIYQLNIIYKRVREQALQSQQTKFPEGL